MTTKPSDLIAIANPELAQKLADKKTKPKTKAADTQDSNGGAEDSNNDNAHKTYRQEIWRAVFTLNIFRYCFSLIILGVGVANESFSNFNPFENLNHPTLFMFCASALLVSAAAFTLFTKTRRFPLRIILIAQFAIDTVTAGLIVHSTGSISSSFSLLFFIIVTTGSVVLRRTDAIALAAGSILVLFFEHFYSVLATGDQIAWRFDSLAMYGVLLMFVGAAISYLAQMVRRAELQSFVPGNESIEDYLVREEINALKSALKATNGNKTEAAKLLGMTFRSFRYKLSKYEI